MGSVGWVPHRCAQCHALLRAQLRRLVLVAQGAAPGCAQVPEGTGSLQGSLWVTATHALAEWGIHPLGGGGLSRKATVTGTLEGKHRGREGTAAETCLLLPSL